MSDDLKQKIGELEKEMTDLGFWQNKAHAQDVIKEIARLKAEVAGEGKYDKGDAVVTIFSGAGGDDAEDFSCILFEMYSKYVAKEGWSLFLIHSNENTMGGYRNITFEVQGKGVYGKLKNESGVHRLVRISPFSAKKLRHTSFSMVEVIPKFEKGEKDFDIPEDEMRVEFSRSSGPGGQNVNKRETAVRVIHIPTNISVHSSEERSQQANREKAMSILRGKLYKYLEDSRIKREEGMYISKITSAEWGSQIRSYVFHPYKMVKDHRTGVETSNVEGVLNGELDEFISAEKDLKNFEQTKIKPEEEN
ncbi:MAG: PCRF domain-containing protein [Candidatus Vogelbacteria bacterium]|nr:PCRF domain-containing protein [Candidatus Vogelbacteria bacterium]